MIRSVCSIVSATNPMYLSFWLLNDGELDLSSSVQSALPSLEVEALRQKVHMLIGRGRGVKEIILGPSQICRGG